MHLVVVIPAYNEGKVIKGVITSLPTSLPGVTQITPLVIDDNSSDDTKALAESCGATCVRHELNLGAGGATVTGLEAAKQLKADIVVTIDADGQHDPTEMACLIYPIVHRQADVVIGSRLKNAAPDMPVYKRFGNNFLNGVTYMFFGIWVSDSQSGYKAFSKRALRKIELSTSGYEFCSEIIGQIKQKHLRFQEVPIATIYTDYSRGKGQLAINAVNIILGLMLRSLRK